MTKLETRTGAWPGGDTRTSGRASPPAAGGLDAWIGTNTLGGVVLQVVRQVDEREIRRVAALNAGLAYRPLTLLALVTYCYATEIYGSADIESLMRRDATFRAQCGNEFPDWRAIRRFRRENREAIHRSLVETFRRLIRVCSLGGDGEPRDGRFAGPVGPNRRPTCRDVGSRTEPNGPCANWPAGNAEIDEQALSDEARRRIEIAMWMDQMAIED
jgi:hypothetical protein